MTVFESMYWHYYAVISTLFQLHKIILKLLWYNLLQLFWDNVSSNKKSWLQQGLIEKQDDMGVYHIRVVRNYLILKDYICLFFYIDKLLSV